MSRSFDELVSEAAAAPVNSWDFSWLDGRATEERPSWGYQRLMSQRLATVSAALDIDTGGGEVLSGAETFPSTMVATESWPPNAALATQLLHPRGVVVVATRDEASLPFADEAFDLVTSRHATVVRWHEIARVLRPGGGYLAQQIGPATMSELFEYFSWSAATQMGRAAAGNPNRAGPSCRTAGGPDAHGAATGGVLRYRRGDLLPAEGDLDGAGLQRRPLSRTPARDASTDRGERPLRRAFDAAARRGPQAIAITARGCNDLRMSMAGMGLMGLVAGASTAGVLGVVRVMGDTWLPRLAASSEQKHQMIATLHSFRHDSVQSWRAGLANARDTYRRWAAGPKDHDPPNAVGDEWFEGLRPHLPSTGEAAKYRTALEVHCDNPTVALLSLEIGRIEREWVDEAKSYPRRVRK